MQPQPTGIAPKPPKLANYLGQLELPADFCNRQLPSRSAEVDRVIAEHDAKVSRRRFLTGLLLAFITMAEELLAIEGKQSVPDVLAAYPPPTISSSGSPVNTLNLSSPLRVVRLRGHYEAVQDVIIGDLRRYGFPSAAPHNTQAWPQHKDELRRIFAMNPAERTLLAEQLWDRVLALDESPARVVTQMTVRPFSKVLADFPNTQPGEPSGAVLQALAYAYYRADAPNVTLEAHKVRTGTARLRGVGDVDGWSGDTLALSIEVKDMAITDENTSEFNGFLRNLRDHRDATAIAFARSFTNEAKDTLRDLGLLVLDRDTMAANVALWDVRKQQVAMQALDYYFARIENKPKLLKRFRGFVADNDLSGD